MGIVLGFALVVGGFIGVMVTGLSGYFAVTMVVRRAGKMRHVWLTSATVAAISLGILVFVTRRLSDAPGNPGGDYYVLMKNFFIRGLGYAAAPGIAALLGALALPLCPSGAER